MRSADPVAAGMDSRRIAFARGWALRYAGMGYQPLPSDPTRKKPLTRFAEWWEGGGPSAEWLWDRFPTTNLQLMTGRHWRLAIVDLDGPEAIERWQSFGRPIPRTWVSTSQGQRFRPGGSAFHSLHVWFSLPANLPPMPKRLLWRGEGKHQAIELLCDRSLVMAPPSIHPGTGRQYSFLSGQSPDHIRRPAMIPEWVLEMPRVEAPSTLTASADLPRVEAPSTLKAPARPLPFGVRRDDVLDAIPDKAAVARAWGVRVVDQSPGPNGWVDCHDIDREDRHPSARFHPAAGLFWRPGERPMSLFDLGVARGHYATWLDCCADLASIYLPSTSGATACHR